MAVSLQEIFEHSPYLAELADRYGEWLDSAKLSPDQATQNVLAEIANAGQTAIDEQGLARDLRIAKARIALLAAISEITGVWTTAQCNTAISDLADVALQAGLALLFRIAASEGRVLRPVSPEAAGLALFALGKHGGRELNYSSDIDIVAFYDTPDGMLANPSEDNAFYVRIVRHLTALMQERSEHGYVFRTDLRLRPDPGSTPIAMPFEAALTYYESRGQNWERAAWIKARVCAGDMQVGERLLHDLAPFVWRKHLDFATISDIQAMKRQINIARKVGGARVAGHNVKLGRGGIREIEFFAQTQQLIAGGRDPALRVRPTTAALNALTAAGWISSETARTLGETYWYLRAVENRLQMFRDEQTHTLPEDPEALEGLARLLDEPDVQTFKNHYRAALAVVEHNYSELFTEGQTLAGELGNLVFTGSDDDPGTLETLAQLGFLEPGNASAVIRKWHYGSYAATRSVAARAHLTELTPALLAAISGAGNADAALTRFDHFLSRLPTGVQLFALLRTHEQLLRLLVAFMSSAPRMAEAVIQRAHVMDGLIDPAFASNVGRNEVLTAKVDDFLADATAYEDLIDRARIIGHEQMFLISAGFLSGAIAAPAAGRQFTALAETLLHRLFMAVQTEFALRHGKISGGRTGLLAFGKMGSREMTVTSDLDFILLYDAPQDVAESDGERPLDPAQYYARLTQRLIAALSAPTAQGVLYEADMRLRPSGKAGPLATSLRAFRRYQTEQAWTWEHLALTRGRYVAGFGSLGAELAVIIAEVLAEKRLAAKVVTDTLDMRERLARDRKPRHPFDIKLAPGGLMELEFIAQSGRLLLGPELTPPGAQVSEILDAMGVAGVLPEAERLADIHRTYSAIVQTMSVCLTDPFKADAWNDAFRDLLARMTNMPDFSRLDAEREVMGKEVLQAAENWYARAQVL
jgi:glutamate-ammonia-ligase adenylyltransferase